MQAKALQSSRSIEIPISSVEVEVERVNGKGMKAIRVNGPGVMTILQNPTPVEAADFATYAQDWNVLQGEQLQLQGNAIISTDGTCSLQVLY